MRFGSGSTLMVPAMAFTASIIVCALLAAIFLSIAFRRLRQNRLLSGAAHGATSLIVVSLLLCAILIAGNLRTYQRLNFEQSAAELQLARSGDRQFNAVLTYPSGERAVFALRGDEWQVDARVLKWRAFATVLGFDTVYRLERISGRYESVEDERTQPRTVFALAPAQHIDTWEWLRRHHAWVPWVDALYGSATFLPMTDGALYEIKVAQSGLVARPLNQAAREAIGGWH